MWWSSSALTVLHLWKVIHKGLERESVNGYVQKVGREAYFDADLVFGDDFLRVLVEERRVPEPVRDEGEQLHRVGWRVRLSLQSEKVIGSGKFRSVSNER